MNPVQARDLSRLVGSLANVAVDHEDSLELSTLVTYILLYAHHLEDRGPGASPAAVATFDAFVRDATLLDEAASTARRITGAACDRPPPLGWKGESS